MTCGDLPEVAVPADLEPGASKLRETIPAAGVVLDVEDGKGGLPEVPGVRDVEPGNHLPLRNAFLCSADRIGYISGVYVGDKEGRSKGGRGGAREPSAGAPGPASRLPRTGQASVP